MRGGCWVALMVTLGLATGLSSQAKSALKPAPTGVSDAASKQAFRDGVRQFQQKQFDAAAESLKKVPELGVGFFSFYKHWFLGQALIELGKYKEAEPEVAKIIQGPASNEMKNQAQFLWGEIALRQKKYTETIARLHPLEKKWRNSYRFPEVLYRLLLADLRQDHHTHACARARKLYSKYPAHALVSGWGADLAAVEVEGKKLNCKADLDDFADRVRSLQWSGESEKAHREIEQRLANAKEDDKFDLDMILAGFFVNEGSTTEALGLLVPYFQKQKTNFSYLMLLGKAAARAGEYQAAVGAYERAYESSPDSKRGRDALYHAAYLSYQFQDYDGAVRKFQQFIKISPRSGLAKDAQWNLAWLQYLRKDFKGALDRFDAVAKNFTAKRHKGDNLQERLQYWSAMSHIRLSQLEDARSHFEKIIAKNPYSYYGLAAQARLDRLPAKPVEPSVQANLEGGAARVVASETQSPVTPAPTTEAQDQESEDSIVESSPQEVEGAGDEEDLKVADIKDPALKARIDVAQMLIQMGLNDLAKWELSEVERSTRNSQLMRQLIFAYETIGTFNRSAAIAENSFAGEREVGGLVGAQALWMAAYPQAFKGFVQKGADDFGVAPEWVWSIMRAESVYKPEVISPVGARGLMQLMQFTARNLTRLRGDAKDDEAIELLDPETNIRLGAQYLARLRSQFKGQLPLVAAAYNAGPHRVEGWLINFGHLDTDEFIEHIPFMETRNYVKKVVRYNTFYHRLYTDEQNASAFLAKELGVPIPSRASTRETW